ncbi:MAG: primosomal protein N' [Phycisphaerales bacterium]|nr:primosomal protein N' [Phycisphaerales bacterium]
MTYPVAEAIAYVRVAVERGIDRYPDGLTYRAPAQLGAVSLGDHVTVPLGRGDSPVRGVVVGIGGSELLAARVSASRIKAVTCVDRTSDPMPSVVVRLAQWISSYYCAPIGVTIAAITPSAVRKGVGRVQKLAVDLAPAQPAASKLHAKRQAVLDQLARWPAAERPVDIDALRDACALATRAPIMALIKSGHLITTARTSVQAKWRATSPASGVAPLLTGQQCAVVEAIENTINKGFSQHLLLGVTGSGKTEVYLRLAQQVLAAGRSVLYLVPEISLTPQTGGRIAARLPLHRMAILHSGLTAAQRHEQWIVAAQSGAKIVIGARSAVFAPIADGELGLIIVDEEHDQSYKQDQAPRYNGRDVAIRRAQLSECPIVMGSATPSMESWFNATKRGICALHQLPQRAPGLRTPRVDIVDFRKETALHKDRRVHLIGPTLEVALRQCFDRGGQAIVLLNRRGYANWITCPDPACGWTMQCDHCEAGMVVHHMSTDAKLVKFTRCHHCQTEQKIPTRCPRCAKNVVIFGLGTQRVEEELDRLFPQLSAQRKIARVDSDSMSHATDFHETLERFGRGDIALLLGTQMIAKGLDFPNVQVVGVISADTALNLPDFRASERTFQLVAQVSGRCGRSDHAGRAIIQTFQPDAEPILAAARQDFIGFAQGEIEMRQRYGLPPSHRLARIIVRHESQREAHQIADRLRGALVALDAAHGVTIRDAAPCAIARIADRWRVHIEILAQTPAQIQKLLATARSRGVLVPGEIVAVDVDPVALL